ncbi:Gfo/Idh/MocA family oxidoreductase [Saccharopolyspora sp. CA-218241]|uniref:Gfo/Idh/MocA family oxidoreductase n=1 Tax=Saccharopolyspora sp. CA-218241 TaxID=3240027 RepID=UPI003D99F313
MELRVGLIGYGVAGAHFHAPLIAADPDLRLDVVVTRGRREQARAAHPDATVVDDLGGLLERAGDLDLAVVASPNRMHHEHTAALLDAGLPVVVDKPFTPTAAAGRALIERAAAAGLMLTVYQNRRWDSDLRTLEALLRDGALGRVHRFESRFERWVPSPKPGWRESGGPEEAGGVLYDLGSHLVDQALHLFGPVAAVYAEIDCLRPGAEVDDDAFLALSHRSGVRSHLWMGKFAAQHGPRLRVLGDRAGFTKHGFDPQEAALRAGDVPGGPEWGAEPEERRGLLGTPDDSRPVPGLPGDYPAFYRGVVAALRDGAAPPVDPADAVAGLGVIEAARRSAAGSTVERLD